MFFFSFQILHTMDTLLKLALSSQTILGGIQFLFFSIFLGAEIYYLQLYHANDRLTFNCSPKPSDFIKQLCYDNYTSTMSPLLIPRNVAVVTYGVLCFCWICFMFYGAVTLRRIIRDKPKGCHRQPQWRKFHRMYIIHVIFRLVFLVFMISIFCSYQTLNLPLVFNCRIFAPQTNTTTIAVNQTETVIKCNDLHFKEKSHLNIAIIFIEALFVMLGISEIIYAPSSAGFQNKLLLGSCKVLEDSEGLRGETKN